MRMDFVLCAFSGAFAVGFSLSAALAIRGKNYSDVGVPMYSRVSTAVFAGVLIFALWALVGYWVLQKVNLLRQRKIFILIHVALFPVAILVTLFFVSF